MIKLSKRVITLILLLIICLTAVSCGKKQEYEASVVFKVRIIETPDDLPEGVQMYQFSPIYADDYVEMLDDSIFNKGEFVIYDNEYLFQIYSMLSLNVEERLDSVGLTLRRLKESLLIKKVDENRISAIFSFDDEEMTNALINTVAEYTPRWISNSTVGEIAVEEIREAKPVS